MELPTFNDRRRSLVRKIETPDDDVDFLQRANYDDSERRILLSKWCSSN